MSTRSWAGVVFSLFPVLHFGGAAWDLDEVRSFLAPSVKLAAGEQ